MGSVRPPSNKENLHEVDVCFQTAREKRVHLIFISEFPEFSVEWFAFRKLNNFRIFWNFSQEIPVPFDPVSKILEIFWRMESAPYRPLSFPGFLDARETGNERETQHGCRSFEPVKILFFRQTIDEETTFGIFSLS